MEKLKLRAFYKLDLRCIKKIKIDPKKLKKGDVFITEEPDGTVVKHNGKDWFIVYDKVKTVPPEKGYVSIPCFSVDSKEYGEQIYWRLLNER